jgi:hypothetical protein
MEKVYMEQPRGFIDS